MVGLLLALTLLVVLVIRSLVGDPAEVQDLSDSSPGARQDLAAAALADVESGVEARDATAMEAGATAAVADRLAANATDLDVADFSLRYVDVDRGLSTSLPSGQWSAAVDATWRFDGFDPAPAHAEITVTFELREGRARVVSFGGGERRTPLWLIADLAVGRSEDSLVLVAGESVGDYALRAEQAVATVERVLPKAEQALVVEVPDSVDQLGALLDAAPSEYSNIAAVTAVVDGSLSPTAPVHVFVNPQMWASLEDQGAQVVMSHEAVHVATGAAVTSGVPLWLLEGFADYVALRDVDLPLSRSAGQIIEQVRAEGAPEALPGASEFDTRTAHLGAAYEAAWLACRVLVDLGSEDALVALYEDVSAGAALEDALQKHFGLSEADLVKQWRARLEELAR